MSQKKPIGIVVGTKLSSKCSEPQKSKVTSHRGSNVPQKAPKSRIQNPPHLKPSISSTEPKVSGNPGFSDVRKMSMTDLKALLADLEEQLRLIDLKWSENISQQQDHNNTDMSDLLEKQKKQMESFITQTRPPITKTSDGVLALKAKAEDLQKKGDPNAAAAMREFKRIESEELDSRRWCQMREVDARADAMKQSHSRSIKIMQDKHQSKIANLQGQKDTEERPIMQQIDEIKAKLHLDQAKVARSTLARKPQ